MRFKVYPVNIQTSPKWVEGLTQKQVEADNPGAIVFSEATVRAAEEYYAAERAFAQHKHSFLADCYNPEWDHSPSRIIQ